MQWIVWKDMSWEEAFGRHIEGICSDPDILRGVELRYLEPEDFADCPANDFVKFLKKTVSTHIKKAVKLFRVGKW